MKKRYLRGLVIPVQTALATQGELDPRQDARGYLEAHDRIPARPEWRDWELGLRAGCRMIRDHGVPGAIDLIAARLWKWGAEEELDEFLASVGMTEEPEPELPPIVAYEKLSGEIILDYAEGGAR